MPCSRRASFITRQGKLHKQVVSTLRRMVALTPCDRDFPRPSLADYIDSHQDQFPEGFVLPELTSNSDPEVATESQSDDESGHD